jgi:hypothetical protein
MRNEVKKMYHFTVPNKLIRRLLWEYIQKALVDAYASKINNNFLKRAFDSMVKTGE